MRRLFYMIPLALAVLGAGGYGAYRYDAAKHLPTAQAALNLAVQGNAAPHVAGAYRTDAVVDVRQDCGAEPIAVHPVTVRSDGRGGVDVTPDTLKSAVTKGCTYAGYEIAALHNTPPDDAEGIARKSLAQTFDGIPSPYRLAGVTVESPATPGTEVTITVKAEARAGWFGRRIEAEGTATYTPVAQAAFVAALDKAQEGLLPKEAVMVAVDPPPPPPVKDGTTNDGGKVAKVDPGPGNPVGNPSTGIPSNVGMPGQPTLGEWCRAHRENDWCAKFLKEYYGGGTQ